MKLSSKTHYGLMACHLLARNYPDKSVSASEMEACLSVSSKYLEKILRMLSKRGIVTANRGASGGYMLTKAPNQITVGDIVRTLEDDIEIIECVKKDKQCKCCPSKAVWQKLYDGINELLDGMTLDDVIKGQI